MINTAKQISTASVSDNSVEHLRLAINGFYRIDEDQVVRDLLMHEIFSPAMEHAIRVRASKWVEQLRGQPSDRTLLEDFMQRYSLSTPEGVALMAIAECFLRVPDTDMADKIIIDKITSADWDSAAQEGEKLLTTFSGWGLGISEAILKQEEGAFGKLIQRLGLPVIRQAIGQAIKLLGGQFVCGRTIEEAIQTAQNIADDHITHSYDMLGEGARTLETADGYFNSYKHAIETIGRTRKINGLYSGDSISVKLSALHPRYEEFQKEKCFPILVQRLKELAILAAKYNVMLTVDAEEADRLEISLDILQAVWQDPDLLEYEGLGLAVQAYQKRAYALVEYLIGFAKQNKKRIPIRLVKGAYWDTEIKRAQERALSGYPVFTRKANTDVSYLVIANKMLANSQWVYPAFGTHNAYTLSAIIELAKTHDCQSFEFQRLHGMGQQLYTFASQAEGNQIKCRIYAPVGPHNDLLPYLVRRLLENGANSSFVNQIYNKKIPLDKILLNPFSVVSDYAQKSHNLIPLPKDIYKTRINPIAPDLSDRNDREQLLSGIAKYTHLDKPPANNSDWTEKMMQSAHHEFYEWNALGVNKRAEILNKIADQLYQKRDHFIALLVYEAKKTIPDAISDWREAIDFCRYYAEQACIQFAKPFTLPGPTGENNQLFSEGRGVYICISPWNFPLAIFMGQIVAALVTGNTVIAKPAEQTTRIAYAAIKLMHECGIPKNVLQLIIASGKDVGEKCIKHSLTAGVVFTGSTKTAWTIQSLLAERSGAIIPFIAETGGQNVMIVDSTALAEQVIDDVIKSAFLSAGQRCSALRVLYLQDEIAPSVINMLKGAMQLLQLGNPALLSTDIGPVIDMKAQEVLMKHAVSLSEDQLAIAKGSTHYQDTFVVPEVFRISKLKDLTEENFGPLLHIITYKSKELDDIINQINSYGYGLTLGIHSRIESRISYISKNVRVGNIYVNRSMIGAVVGVQPFGGMGLSGTGPKAGGPHYLYRFVTEKTVTVNTTAAGGNTTLTMLSDE